MLLVLNIFLRFLDPVFNVERSWDVAASIIAMLSICIAIASFIIALKTLKSQNQTAKNTMPVITHEIQKELLDRMIVKMWDNHITLNALKITLDEVSFACYPSKEIMQELIIDTSLVHMDLFYKDLPAYKKMHILLERIQSFNLMISVINEDLSKSSIPVVLMKNNIDRVIKQNILVAQIWSVAMNAVYNYDDMIKQKRLSSIIEKIPEILYEKFSEDLSNPIVSNCYTDDFFVNIFKIEEQRKKMLIVMRIYTSQMQKEIKDRIIPRH